MQYAFMSSENSHPLTFARSSPLSAALLTAGCDISRTFAKATVVMPSLLVAQ